jgi:hypothetical protein
LSIPFIGREWLEHVNGGYEIQDRPEEHGKVDDSAMEIDTVLLTCFSQHDP